MPDFSLELLEISLRSLLLSAAAVGSALILGLPLGIYAGVSRGVFAQATYFVAQVGMGLPPVAAGLVGYLLLSRTGIAGELRWLFSFQAMWIVQTLLCFPFIVALTASALRRLPDDFDMQAHGIGIYGLRLWVLRLREIQAGIGIAVAAAFGRSFSEVGAIMIVGGNIKGSTRTLTTSIILETNQGEFGKALWLAGILLSLAIIVNVLAIRAQGDQR